MLVAVGILFCSIRWCWKQCKRSEDDNLGHEEEDKHYSVQTEQLNSYSSTQVEDRSNLNKPNAPYYPNSDKFIPTQAQLAQQNQPVLVSYPNTNNDAGGKPLSPPPYGFV